jgi:uncharacterized membrane protein YbaN (DUF454 family)
MDHTTIDPTNSAPLASDKNGNLRILFFRVLGLVCVGLGILGAILPLMPATCFFIAAVYCFAQSAPEWRQRILDHPRFGPPVATFVREGALSRRAKIIAVGGIAANFILTLLVTDLDATATVILAAVLLTVSAYLVTRPEPAAVKVTA